MNYIKKIILPCVLTVITIVLLIIFRSVPASQLWKGFSALYVPVNTDSSLVFNALSESGCKDVISYYNQQIPYINEFLPLKDDSSDSYLAKRNAYFFDKDKRVMIYYIPNMYKKNATKAASILVTNNIDAGLDAQSSFPLATPIICLIVAVLFFIFSKNKIPFLLATIFPLLFTLSMPFYINAATVSIYLYTVYLIQFLWNRKGNLRCVLTCPFILILISLSLIASFFVSLIAGFVFLLCVVTSFFILVSYFYFDKTLDSKRRFNPVPIRPAFLINVININSVRKMFISTISVTVLFILYIFSVNIFSISNSQDLSFPMPTSYNEKSNIPVMEDYINWTWNTVTKPYRSVNSSKSSEGFGELITVNRFVNTQKGIESRQEILFSFDSDFKKSVICAIDELNYPAVEKLMKNQEDGFFVNYSKGAGEKFSISGLIIMLIMITVPGGMAIYYLTGRKKYGSAY